MSSTHPIDDREDTQESATGHVGVPETDSLSILRVASDVYPDVTGGLPIHAHAMSKRQAERGHDVTVLTSNHGDGDRPVVETRDGYTIVRHREIARPFGNSITPTILASIRDRISEAHVVHAHSHLYFTTNVVAAVARFTDVPFVVTNHGLISQTAPKCVQNVFIPTVGRFTFKTADRILCYTRTDRQRLQNRGIKTSIEVVNNGIDCQQFTPEPEPEQSRLLFVGRLTDGKGVPTLLDAFARLGTTYPDLELRIVGDGPEREAYESRCRHLGIADRVTFVGDVSYREMPRHYNESRVFVLPSHSEGLPRTVLEAMASETPVVTSALPQLEEVVADAGFTVERGATEEIVDAVSQLLENDAMRGEFGQNGRRKVLEHNAWERTVEETTAVFYDLVDDTS